MASQALTPWDAASHHSASETLMGTCEDADQQVPHGEVDAAGQQATADAAAQEQSADGMVPATSEARMAASPAPDDDAVSVSSSQQSSLLRLVEDERPTAPAIARAFSVKQIQMDLGDGMPLAQHNAASSSRDAADEGRRGTVSRRPSIHDPASRSLKSLSRQGSASRSLNPLNPLPPIHYDEVQVANIPTADDAFVLNTDDVPGAVDFHLVAAAVNAEDSDSSFSASSASPPVREKLGSQPEKPAAGTRISNSGRQQSGGLGDNPSRPEPKARTSASPGGPAGVTKQASKTDQAPLPALLPPVPRPKGAAPFMERSTAGLVPSSARPSGQAASPPASVQRPIKGLPVNLGSQQQQQQQQQPDSPGTQGQGARGSPLRGIKPSISALGPSSSEMQLLPGEVSSYTALQPKAFSPDGMGVMEGAFMVKGLRDRHAPAAFIDQHRRERKPGRLTFRNLFGPQAYTGGGTLPPSMIRDGLQRRAAAAVMMARGPPPFTRKPEPRPPTPDGVKLDGFMMLEAGDEDLPENVVAVKLSHRNIDTVEVADMAYFPVLRVLDLSDNRVPGLEGLSGLVGLRQLFLASNHLHSLGNLESSTALRELQVLDLTYNTLKPNVLGISSPLAALPSLRELDLSGNSLSQLPDDLGAFPSLTLLRLNNNRLSGAALVPLGMLPSLRELSLSGNVVTAVYEDVADPGSFPQLQVLDLTHNKISDEASVSPLSLLPNLRMLLLAGNPMALAHQAKKAREQRDTKPSSSDGASRAGGLQIIYHHLPDLPPKPTIADNLAAHSHQIPKALDSRAASKAAGEAVVAATSDEALMEAFDRVDNAIDAWQLNTVDEEDEEESDEDTGPMEEDGTFLTGIGIEDRQKRQRPKKDEPEPEAVELDRPLWEDVTDPTERLALALGLDPRQLAIYTGRLTTDSVGSINALRFALAHPLVEADEGLRPPRHHLGMTTAAKLKRRDRKLAPLSKGAAASVKAPPDVKTVRIQTIEGMLQGMKDRLKGLESSLTDKLAAAQRAGGVPSLGKSKSGNEGSDDDDGSRASPRREGDVDDARSDMSPLPDDVIDAIENPALSESDDEAGNYLVDDLDPDGQSPPPEADGEGGGGAGAGPSAAAAAAAEGWRAKDVPASATNTLGYG